MFSILFILTLSIGLFGFYRFYMHKPEVKEWIWVGDGENPIKE